MSVKKTITIPEGIYKKILEEVKNDYRSSFNREVNYILQDYFREGVPNENKQAAN